MVYLSKIYTRSGDDGGTMLADGSRRPKHDPRVSTYGEVDELNAVVGLLRVELAAVGACEPLQAADANLARVQQELFDLGAELSTPSGEPGSAPKIGVTAGAVTRLEEWIDAMNGELDPLRSFVLPGGGRVGAVAHLARTVCRRAERAVTALATLEPVRPLAVSYLNRLSDALFVLARFAAHTLGEPEVLWTPGAGA